MQWLPLNLIIYKKYVIKFYYESNALIYTSFTIMESHIHVQYITYSFCKICLMKTWTQEHISLTPQTHRGQGAHFRNYKSS